MATFAPLAIAMAVIGVVTGIVVGIATSLIQSIHISEPTIVDGEKTYEIDIRYKFQNTLYQSQINQHTEEARSGIIQ